MPGFFDFYSQALRLGLGANGFRSRFVALSESKLHLLEYRGAADGVFFVILHGIGASAVSFSPLLNRLRRHASIIWAPDLPGHGLSPLPCTFPGPQTLSANLTTLLVGLIEKPVVLIGTSLGGALALRFALDQPHLVARLVLCSPAGAPMSQDAFDRLRMSFQISTAGEGRAFLRRLFHRPPWYGSMAGGEVRRMLTTPMVRHLLSVSDQSDLFTPAEVSRLETPTLLIWGQSEKVLPRECLDWFRAHLPSAVRIDEPADYGHSAHLEKPADLAARILEFATVTRSS